MDAEFSIPWGVASAIVGRRVGLDDFTDSAIRNREVLEVTQKMRVEVDNTLHKPGPEPTRVTVVTKMEKLTSKVVENPLGSLERPMSSMIVRGNSGTVRRAWIPGELKESCNWSGSSSNWTMLG